MKYVVNLTWDPEASVWGATSDDIPGLVLESGSFDALLERVRFAAPELLELNSTERPVLLSFRAERMEKIAL
ncbi:DUF1902 domain-containing protein [uncultured Oscillibacter sp.]|jgi:hypothetical protein|uniref:DUF1902 domain-containing protein n=1 Tax=uncultured Oscillibacter sp. TaxID=876091 RepID=UPI00260F2B7B|nr:DUF1902 domain-containing protein [uncultured Oscillibacter sp.]